MRLFVLVPKDMAEDDLRTEFEKFGEVEHVSIVKDKVTKERRGFAYIRFSRFSHAAEAYEECNVKYKAVFAEPKATLRTGPGGAPLASGNNIMGGDSRSGAGGSQSQHGHQHHQQNQHHQHGHGQTMMDGLGGSGGGGASGRYDQSDRRSTASRYNDDSYSSSSHNSRFDLHSAFSMPVTSSSNGPPLTEASLSIVCSAAVSCPTRELWTVDALKFIKAT